MANKVFKSPNYNYTFNTNTGEFCRWGKTPAEDPDFSPFGPEIADIEISTICHGINNKPCSFCYKSNSPKGKNMSFETFKEIFHKLPKTLTQIAFGIGDLDGNKDLFRILEYCRNNSYNLVVPNITINGWGLTDEIAKKLVELCGAISVSNYGNEVFADAVKKLTKLGHKQVNIHQLVCEESMVACFSLITDIFMYRQLGGGGLNDVNAIVYLAMKPKGKRNKLHLLKDKSEYKQLIEHAMDKEVNIGFDSCSAPMFLEAVKDSKDYKAYKTLVEPCESWLFSIYINVEGVSYPCSFTEGEKGFKGVNLLETDFMEFWNGKQVGDWREKLLATEKGQLCRRCPQFDIY